MSVNLGTAFHVGVTGLEQYRVLAKDLGQLKAALEKAGLVSYGDWPGLMRYLWTMQSRTEASLRRASTVVGLMHWHDIEGALNTQRFKPFWRPLNPRYLARKIRRKLDRRSLIATGAALKSLGIETHALGVTVGFQATHNGVAYMAVNEFGTIDGSTPPRPIVRQTLDAEINRYTQVYADAIGAALAGGVYAGQIYGAP